MAFRRGYKRKYAMKRKYIPRYKKKFRTKMKFRRTKSEKKHKDSLFVANGVVIAAFTKNLFDTGLTQGLGSTNMLGRRIILSGCKFIYTVEPIVTKVALQFVRIILGTYSATSIPLSGNILEDTSNPITSMYNMTTSNKFQILYDRTHVVAGNGDGGAGSNIGVRVSKYISFKNRQVMMSASPTAIPVNFNPFLMIFGSEISGTNLPDVSIAVRLYFYDP